MRLSRGALATAAAVFFVACSGVAILQSPRIPTHAANASWRERFLSPVERNPPLYALASDLYGVYAADERHVWAVGNHGAIIHTEDGGRTWVKQPTRPAPTGGNTTPAAGGNTIPSQPPADNTNANATNTNTSTNATNSNAAGGANGDSNSSNAGPSNRRATVSGGNRAGRRTGVAPSGGRGSRNRNANSGPPSANSNRDLAHAPAPHEEPPAAATGVGPDNPRAAQTPPPTQQPTPKPVQQGTPQPTPKLTTPTPTPPPQQGPPTSRVQPRPTPVRLPTGGGIQPDPALRATGGNANASAPRPSSATPRPTPANTTSRAPAAAGNANAANNTNAANTNDASNANTSTNTNSNSSANASGGEIQEDLGAVIFNGEQYGWALARDGETIFTTLDGGATWRRGMGFGLAQVSLTSRRIEYFVPETLNPFEWGLLTDRGELVSTPDPTWIAGIKDVLYDWATGQGWGIAVGEKGAIYIRVNGSPQSMPSGTTATLRSVNVVGSDHKDIWIVGEGGTVLHSTDSLQTLQSQQSGTATTLNGVYFLDDARHGFAVGRDGLILGTSDGGANWVRLTRGSENEKIAAGAYSRGWPGWYYLSLFVTALLLAPAVVPRKKDEPEPEVSVADVLVSDRPLEAGDPDPLHFRSVALGLSRFLRNENTLPPLTIAITGEWGTGKSSLMNLLRADLRSYGFRPVWFNAWHHQKEEHLLAALLQNVRLQAIPPWWRRGGLRFRARLLVIRGWRRWLPALALLFVFAGLAVYAVSRFQSLAQASAAQARAAQSNDPIQSAAESFRKWLGGKGDKGDRAEEKEARPDAEAQSGAQPTRNSAPPPTPLLALVVSVVGGVVTVWRGAQAFGANPASLLASVSQGMKLRDLDAQTSFRKKFADEFGDVTRALGERSMIVFIDDLDRCKPENVIEVLEGVNFLVSSGECFVVLGMARDLVERYVGLSFKDVAAEVAAEDGAAAKSARVGRAEFARQYLDKLVNIEVPVPEPTAEQSSELLVNAGVRPAPPSVLALRWEQAKELTARAAPIAAALVALAAGGFAGSYLNDRLHSAELQPVASAPNANAQTTDGGAATDAAGADVNAADVNAATNANVAARANRNTAQPGAASNQNSLQTDAAAEARRSEDEQRARSQTAALSSPASTRRSPLSYWLPALALALAASVVAWRLTRRPDLVVKDSDEFKEALRIWHTVLFDRLRTPRALKRFMNRVRYLAMRQRPPARDLSLWSRLRARLARGVELKTAEAAEESPTRIPEHMLVALSAAQQINPKLDFVKEILYLTEDHTPPGLRKIRQLLILAEQEHKNRFGYMPSDLPEAQRAAFLKMSAGIRVN